MEKKIENLHNFGYKHGGIFIDTQTEEFETTGTEEKNREYFEKINFIIRKTLKTDK